MQWLFEQKSESAPVVEDKVTVETIVANTSVGDGQREVNSFVITVDDINLVKDLAAADFTIKNNVATTVYDKDTGTFLEDMEDDGITLSISGNTITLTVTPFSYPGMYNADFTRAPWEVICTKYEELSFTAEDVTELKTAVLDDAIRGTFEYAGIEREYALYLPKDEDGNVIMNSSLVLWNHGGGEYGGDLEDTLVANKGFTAWVEQGYPTAVVEFQISNANYSYYTAADATEESGGTAEEKAERRKLIDQNNALQAAFIRQLIADGYVDASRVYITGASSGGGATMRFVMQYPELVAGAIAISSHDPIVWVHKNPDAELESLTEKFEEAFQGTVYTWDEESQSMVEKQIDTEALINTPIYFVHAESDPTCNVLSSKAMYAALQNLGAENNQIKILSDDDMLEYNLPAGALSHWAWVPTLDDNSEGSAMNWLFQQKSAQKTTDEEKPGASDEEKPTASGNTTTTTSTAASTSTNTAAALGTNAWTAAGIAASAAALFLLKKRKED
jgi:predicted peptidase/predicted RNA-binding protein with TRAM domain